jgi:hypothetical protein
MVVADKLRVVFLSGSGHTGTTLLALFMDAHPQVTSVGEVAPTRKNQSQGEQAIQTLRCSCGQLCLECVFWQRVFQRMEEHDGVSGYRWTHDYRYKHHLVHKMLSRSSHRASVQLFQRVAAAAFPAHRAWLAEADRTSVLFIQSVLGETGAEVFFDTSKNPARLARLLTLDRLDVRLVRIARDVRGFAGSAKRRGQPIEAAAGAWQNRQRIVARLANTMPPEKVFFLRYEDFCRNPGQWLRQLHAFVGVDVIEPPATVRPRDHHVLGNSIRLQQVLTIRAPDPWQERLTHDEIAAIMRVAGATNAKLGYEC